MNDVLTWILACLGVCSVLAPVTASSNEPLTLDQAVREALASNPALVEIRARWDAMTQRSQSAVALPNPMFRYGGMDSISSSRSVASAEHHFMMEQMLPALGKRALRREIAEAEADAAYYRWRATAQEVIAQVKETFFDLQALQRSRTLLQEEVEIVRQIIGVMQTRYAAGLDSLPPVTRAEKELVEIARRDLELATRESEQMARLSRLLGRAPETSVVLQSADPPTALLARAAIAFVPDRTLPEVRMAEADIRRFDAERKLAPKSQFPDVSVGLEYRAMPMGEDMAMIVLGIELPVWRRAIHSRIREAAAMARAGRAAMVTAELQSKTEAASLAAALQDAVRSLDLLRRQQIPQIEMEIAALEAAYRAGRADFPEVLDASRRRVEAAIQETTMSAKVGQLAARFERALGISTGLAENEEQ